MGVVISATEQPCKFCPACMQKGDLTTVEGLLRATVLNLQLNQSERAPDVAEKIEECIQVGW